MEETGDRKGRTGRRGCVRGAGHQYRRDVTRTVLFTVSDAHVVEDLVQETFLRAFRSLGKF